MSGAERLVIAHGTPKGYGQHHRSRTPACTPCLEAHRESVWAGRIRLGRIGALFIPLDVLAAVLDSGSAEALSAYLGVEVVDAIKDRATEQAGRE